MEKFALLSVSDKHELLPFAKALAERGFTLLSTGGTAAFLREEGLAVKQVSDHTGFPEILDGRVKTLHPRVHAGILARETDEETLLELEIPFIDVVVCNLYPFEAKRDEGLTIEELTEFIDVGGPSMLRAAAKNWQRVYVLTSPDQYGRVLSALDADGCEVLRRELAANAFQLLSHYDAQIAMSLTTAEHDASPTVKNLAQKFNSAVSLRYGENPHQQAWFHAPHQGAGWDQLQGKALSYNNLLDLDNALRWVLQWSQARSMPERHAVAIFKHASPCGAALAFDGVNALERARASDPRSHFGGIVASSSVVHSEFAKALTEHFTEIVVAPDFSDEALAILAKRPQLRVIRSSREQLPIREFRSVSGGILEQEVDTVAPDELQVFQTHKLGADLLLAWQLCQLTRSNAITIVKESTLVGSGVGETSRIDALENALRKATLHGHDLTNAVAASDAFFPFPDSVEVLALHGVKTVISPSGSKNDDQVRARAVELGVELTFMPRRHFRH